MYHREQYETTKRMNHSRGSNHVFYRVYQSRHATENLTRNNRNEYTFSDTSWNVAEGCFIYLFIYQRERVYRLIHRDTFDRQKCQCTREVWYYFGSRGVANLKIGAKWETAEAVVGPTGKLAACQIHRKRTGIVHDSISVSRPFFSRPSSRPSENRLFRLQIFESLLYAVAIDFSVEKQNVRKRIWISRLVVSLRFNSRCLYSRLYIYIDRILVCGLNFHGDYFVLFVWSSSSPGFHDLCTAETW